MGFRGGFKVTIFAAQQLNLHKAATTSVSGQKLNGAQTPVLGPDTH